MQGACQEWALVASAITAEDYWTSEDEDEDVLGTEE
jgi:hypothetical protein